ncbi:hypothetical protein HDV06_000500 [Boothiomyces sp. JEL0866]|nr:hypothetical protein HDV06_000500 [Boothiomyces sp. JEL0866]
MDEREKQQRLEFAKSKFKSYQKKKRESEANEILDHQTKNSVEISDHTSNVYPNSSPLEPTAQINPPRSPSPRVLVQPQAPTHYGEQAGQQYYHEEPPTEQYYLDQGHHHDSHLNQYQLEPTQNIYQGTTNEYYQENAPQQNVNATYQDYSAQNQQVQSSYDNEMLMNEINHLRSENLHLADRVNQITNDNELQKKENTELHGELKKQKQLQASLELKIDQHVKELKQVLLKNQQLQSKEATKSVHADVYEGKYHELEIIHQQLQARCSALEEDNQQLISSNNQLESDFLRISNDLQDRDTTIEQLNNDLTTKNLIIEEKESAIMQLEADLSEIAVKNKAELESVNATLTTQQETVQLMKQKVQDVTKQLQSTQDAFNITKQDEIKLKNENQELFAQLSELRQKIISTQNEKQELVEESSKLKYYISKIEKEGRRNSITATRSTSISVPQPQMYQMGNQTSPSLLSPGLVSPGVPIPEKSTGIQAAPPVPPSEQSPESPREETVEQLKTKLLELNINYTSLVKEKQATVANLTQQMMSLKLENDNLRSKIANTKSSQPTIDNLQQTIAQNQNVIRHLQKELDNEKRLTVLLQAELEALPDMIQKYHQERQNLLQKVNKINLQDSKKELVVVKKESIRIHCGECAGNPIIQL